MTGVERDEWGGVLLPAAPALLVALGIHGRSTTRERDALSGCHLTHPTQGRVVGAQPTNGVALR